MSYERFFFKHSRWDMSRPNNNLSKQTLQCNGDSAVTLSFGGQCIGKKKVAWLHLAVYSYTSKEQVTAPMVHIEFPCPTWLGDTKQQMVPHLSLCASKKHIIGRLKLPALQGLLVHLRQCYWGIHPRHS